MPPSTPAARWLPVLGLGFIAAGTSAVAWRAPGVFPLSDPLWWSSTGLVLGAWLVVALAGLAAWRRWPAVLAAALLVPGGALVAIGVAGRLTFPWSLRVAWAIPFLLGVMWTLGLLRAVRRLDAPARGWAWSGLVPGVLVGASLVQSRVPPPPATHPRFATWAEAQRAVQADAALSIDALPLPPHHPGEPVSLVAPTPDEDGRLKLPCGTAALELSARLTFQSTSRDGFWPGLSTPERLGGAQALSVSQREGAWHLDARTEVPRAVHAHLNTFAEVRLTGLSRPAVQLSPTGAARYELLPFDYPRGRPARFAWLGPTSDFVVAQASDAEKGPFIELGRGRLAPNEALTVTVLEDDSPQCDVTFLDFAAQADTSRSPTAGEGVAVNVVQFGLPAKAPGVAVVHLSLAETGIGAGLDTVAHAPGVYRNRVRVTPR